jgi:hypothetical protein
VLGFGGDAGATITTASTDESLTISPNGTGTIIMGNTLTLSSDSNEGINGGGLTDCDQPTDKLLWDSTSNKFSCGTNIGEVRAFNDDTNDSVADNDTTEYWDGTEPNITLANTNDQVMINMTVVFLNQANNQDLGAAIHRDTTGDGNAACTDSLVISEITSSSARNAAQPVLAITWLDVITPATANKIAYTVCSSDSTYGTNAEVDRIDMILSEVGVAADLAEVYATNDKTITLGEVVSLDPSLKAGVKRSTIPYDSTAIGVVSTRPAKVIGGTEGEGISGVPVALSGRVPVFVSTENGPINPGDLLTSSSIPGFAMKLARPGPVIGIAMAQFDPDVATQGEIIGCPDSAPDGITCGKVNMFVKSSYYDPGISIDEYGDLNFSRLEADGQTIFEVADKNNIRFTNLAVFQDAKIANLQAGKVTTQQLQTQTLGLGTSPPASDSGMLLTTPSGSGITDTGKFVQSEDISRKDQIAEYTDALEKVMALKTVSYKDKQSGQAGIGFIAQDVKEVLPEIVYGEEGSMSIAYNDLTALLAQAIQEQQVQIDTLTTSIASVSAKLDAKLVDTTTLSNDLVSGSTSAVLADIIQATPAAQFAVSQPSATIQDVYELTDDLVPLAGDIVTISTASASLAVEKSSLPYQSTVLGVTDNVYEDGQASIITNGQASLTVSTVNGPIKKGDMLTSSSVPGLAMKATQAGFIVGVALEDFDGSDIVITADNSSFEASASALTDTEQIALTLGRLESIVEQQRQAKTGTIKAFIRPQLALPPVSCDLTDIFCRSTYFAYFAQDGFGTSTSAFDGTISYAAVHDLIVSGTLFVGRISLTDNSGQSIIVKDSSEAWIESTSITDKSIVYVTFEADYSPATRYYVANKEIGQGFLLKLDQPVGANVPFNWWIVEGQNSSVFLSPTPAVELNLNDLDGLSVTPQASATPTIIINTTPTFIQTLAPSALPTIQPTLTPPLPTLTPDVLQMLFPDLTITPGSGG